jgi:hypothetical protein
MIGRSPASLLALILAGWPVGRTQSGPVEFLGSGTEAPSALPRAAVIDRLHAWVGLSHTSDGGATWVAWSPHPKDATSFLNFPSWAQPSFFATDQRGWLSGRDAVWATNNSGRTWVRLFAGHIHAMAFTPGGSGWMGVGDHRKVRNLVSSDKGRTWSVCGEAWVMKSVAPLGSAFFLDGGRGWITVAKYGERELPVIRGIAGTEDGGCTWNVLWWDADNSWEHLGEIRFVDDTFGWLLAAGQGKMRKTLDGGFHWSDLPLPAEKFYLVDGCPIDRERGWIKGFFAEQKESDSDIFFTPDSGAHWQAISKVDLLEGRGLARDLPQQWRAGFLARLLAGQALNKAKR